VKNNVIFLRGALSTFNCHGKLHASKLYAHWSTSEPCSVTSNVRDMHRCFLIPEIVQLVCDSDEFAEDGFEVQAETRRTLTALALTCRLFHEPALDRLWRHLGSLGPLVKCMPSDLWKVRRESYKELLV
jgi:hypothetical protein